MRKTTAFCDECENPIEKENPSSPHNDYMMIKRESVQWQEKKWLSEVKAGTVTLKINIPEGEFCSRECCATNTSRIILGALK